MASSKKTLKIEAIETAKIRQGEVTGRVLLMPGADGDWVIGHHDGRQWFDDYTDTKISPEFWVRLPTHQELIDC